MECQISLPKQDLADPTGSLLLHVVSRHVTKVHAQGMVHPKILGPQ